MHRFAARARAALRRPANLLIVAQLCAIVVAGAATVDRFHVFAPIDEATHFAYVQEIAEHGRLPFLGRDAVSWQVLAINDETYPGPPRGGRGSAAQHGLVGESYEAFQPPLYYALAAPSFLLASDYRDKVRTVRAFDLALLLAGLALLGVLARRVLGNRWRAPYALALSVALWPGVIVRSVTVSSAPLEIPVVALYLLAVWSATERRSRRWLVAAGGLLAVCVLTKVTFVALAPLLLLPLVAVVRARRDRRTAWAVAGTFALPAALVLPWVISNEERYGALTGNAIAKRIQEPSVNPTHRTYGPDYLREHLDRFGHAAMPQEWWASYLRLPWSLLDWLPVILLGFALLAVVRRPGLLRTRAAAVLGAPLPLACATLAGIVLLADWPSYLPRYLYSCALPFGLFAGWAWIHGARPAADGAPAKPDGGPARTVLLVALACSLLALVGWAYGFGGNYFRDVGSALGIHQVPG